MTHSCPNRLYMNIADIDFQIISSSIFLNFKTSHERRRRTARYRHTEGQEFEGAFFSGVPERAIALVPDRTHLYRHRNPRPLKTSAGPRSGRPSGAMTDLRCLKIIGGSPASLSATSGLPECDSHAGFWFLFAATKRNKPGLYMSGSRTQAYGLAGE